MPNPIHNRAPINNNPESSPFLTVIEGHGLAIAHENGNALMRYDGAADYPSRAMSGEAVNTMLLETVEEQTLLLPKNFVTLGQALNDAAGQVRNERGQVGARMLFTELGVGLSRIALMERKVPRSISYLNVIYSREEQGAKLLPPLQLVEFDNLHKEQAKTHVIDSLWQTLEAGAANNAQKRLVAESFSGFIRVFDW